MRGDMCGSKNSGQGSTRAPEADRPDLDVEQRLTQAFGRPPDREAREFDENDVMELEENGRPIEGPHIIVLLEPRISGKNADKSIRRIGYPNFHRMEANGFSGGIWLLWDDFWHVEVLDTKNQFIHCRVWDERDMNFKFTAVYGHPSPSRRDILWQQLTDIQTASELPWVLLGDFNSIARGSERVGGSANRSGVSLQFVWWLMTSGLIDLGFLGPSFMWRRGTLHERLDIGLCSSEWRLAYPKASVLHLVRYQSDNRPLLLNLCSPSPSMVARPF
ncbi:hypothetical protein SASPL_117310 [Salvia splendens]|uniref:Endonuclease/exonuclease/phosphatase domain-containing protein n=1 Tax=Salvia splendens TaxID=180675 RepID=A0A8X8XUR1_SALSN|nr:hypothetical protein SASPL_117310 [Salvia splendens]